VFDLYTLYHLIHAISIFIYISRSPGFFVSTFWQYMIVSWPINLILYFKGNLFIVVYIFLIVRLWTSCSVTLFIVGDTAGKFILLLSTNIFSMAVLELFLIPYAKFTECNKLYVVNNETVFFSPLLSKRQSKFVCPQIKNSAIGVYRWFKTSSRVFINRLKPSTGTLYKINIINVNDLVPS